MNYDLIRNKKIKFLGEERLRFLIELTRVLPHGDERDDIKNRIVLSLQPLCLDLANKFFRKAVPNSLEVDDYFQEGVLTIDRAIDGFDLERGISFLTYVYPSIWNAMRKLRDFRGDVIHTPLKKRDNRVVVEEFHDVGRSISPDVITLAREKVEDCLEDIRIMKELVEDHPDKRRSQIFQAYYFLEGEESKTLEEVGEMFGITPEWVRRTCLGMWKYLKEVDSPIFDERGMIETKKRIESITDAITCTE